jgi:hypothetical protein
MPQHDHEHGLRRSHEAREIVHGVRDELIHLRRRGIQERVRHELAVEVAGVKPEAGDIEARTDHLRLELGRVADQERSTGPEPGGSHVMSAPIFLFQQPELEPRRLRGHLRAAN